MLVLDGYTVGDQSHASSHSRVYTAVRQSDQLPVVLKTYRGSRGSPGVRSRAANEFELLDALLG